jgi:hypothetical protein
MGGSKKESVVNHRGEVWDYPNLYVADASIIPSALSVNPSLTISALAERVGFWIVNDREMEEGESNVQRILLRYTAACQPELAGCWVGEGTMVCIWLPSGTQTVRAGPPYTLTKARPGKKREKEQAGVAKAAPLQVPRSFPETSWIFSLARSGWGAEGGPVDQANLDLWSAARAVHQCRE